jgi:hypothetical protein
MDGEQSTVAGAPKQLVILPSETVVPVDVKNVCKENRGIAPPIKLGNRSSHLGCFTLAITKPYVRRGICPRISPLHLAPSVAEDPRSWLMGVREISFVFIS